MRAELTIDLGAIVANWRALDAMSGPNTETGAVVKADAYGLGLSRVAPALAQAGATTFFVALAEEGADLRECLGTGPRIFVFSGLMEGDAALMRSHALVPLINSAEQMRRLRSELGTVPFGIQLDSGMNRLGVEAADISTLIFAAPPRAPDLVLSHLACADDPTHLMNGAQLASFSAMASAFPLAQRSLAATGGIILGRQYHFHLTRPGIGLYGGLPFRDAAPVVSLTLPVIQSRDVLPGEAVGYGASWSADRPRKIATVASGYADGILRALGGKARLFAGKTECPLVGRVSMDLLTVDVSALGSVPERLTLLGPQQGIDALAEAAGTIGYEFLTSLGHRYARHYVEPSGG